MSICPKHAFSLVEDVDYHETTSTINAKLCIDCGLCIKVCHNITPSEKYLPQSCYAAWLPKEIRPDASSSGGIAYAVSRQFILDGGLVVACIVKNNVILHTVIDSVDELQKACGSKYVQSDISGVFDRIKDLLLTPKRVLFIGTPCQVDAIRVYMGASLTHNLYTCDLICHGTPPARMFNSWVEDVYPGVNDLQISFRKNDKFVTTLHSQSGRRPDKIIPQVRNWYIQAFFSGLIFREACYICQYASKERVGDLTLGDFWGVDDETVKQSDGSVSLVLVNTTKGEKLYGSIQNDICFHQKNMDMAVNGNMQLREPMKAHCERDFFLKQFSRKGFSAACRMTSLKKGYLFTWKIPFVWAKNKIIAWFSFFR